MEHICFWLWSKNHKIPPVTTGPPLFSIPSIRPNTADRNTTGRVQEFGICYGPEYSRACGDLPSPFNARSSFRWWPPSVLVPAFNTSSFFVTSGGLRIAAPVQAGASSKIILDKYFFRVSVHCGLLVSHQKKFSSLYHLRWAIDECQFLFAAAFLCQRKNWCGKYVRGAEDERRSFFFCSSGKTVVYSLPSETMRPNTWRNQFSFA